MNEFELPLLSLSTIFKLDALSWCYWMCFWKILGMSLNLTQWFSRRIVGTLNISIYLFFSPFFIYLLVYKVPTPGIIPMRFIVSLPRCESVVNLHMRVSSWDKCVFFFAKKNKNSIQYKGKMKLISVIRKNWN